MSRKGILLLRALFTCLLAYLRNR